MNRLSRLTILRNKVANNVLAVRNAAHQTQVQESDDDWSYKSKAFRDAFEGLPIEPNPGPNITMDYMPIPCQPYEKVHKELQYKFNIFLGLNVVLCLITCWMSYTYDIWQQKDYMLPESYLNRHKINAKLRAEEEAAAKEGMSNE